MTGRALLMGLVLLPSLPSAQTPDVAIRLDLLPTYRSARPGGSSFRFYDAMGRLSTVGLSMILEPGFRILVSERLQTIDGDGDTEQLDEYYIEDEGVWRLGKQYLPFARNGLVRESVVAVRTDTNLVLEGLPISIAACDGGPGRTRGVIGRIGTRIGVSIALGEGFGTSSGTFAAVRRPEEAPGSGHGYGQMFGFDVARRFGPLTVSGEWVAVRSGATAAEPDREVLDLVFALAPDWQRSYLIAVSHDSSKRTLFFRAQGSLPIGRGVSLEPLIKLRGSEIADVGVSVHMKF